MSKEQVKILSDEFYKIRHEVKESGKIDNLSKSDDDLRTLFTENNEEFQKFAYNIAKGTIKRTNNPFQDREVNPIRYAAIVSLLADKLGIDYITNLSVTAVAGASVIKEYHSRIEKAEEAHPLPFTSLYVEANGESYEYYNKVFTHLEHIDTIPVDKEA
jgi:hypothetical protein